MVDPVNIVPERMTCMEIWGGNQAIDKYFEAPGIDIYVHSSPYKDSQTGGGDIYYLTSCASGRISRFLLADVSGHGESASEIALSLRDLLRKNVNKISQQQFVSEMNVEFGELGEESKFATAVVATFFEPKNRLDISVAGHPYPIFYSASKQKWVHLDPTESDQGLENLPLGIHDESNYPGRMMTTGENDMFLLYSDAFIESVNTHHQMLGIKGVLEILNATNQLSPHEVIPFLRSKIGTMADGNLTDDDATMILGHFTSTKVRMKDNLMAPFRLLGDVCDNTQLGQ
ncbi:MAG: PP2C family protein-serine/threonine phosphatase [Mariniblastus sp.]|nr:PP2C family protein-serine/threonine phosphatase [Mariniblastus sp.]